MVISDEHDAPRDRTDRIPDGEDRRPKKYVHLTDHERNRRSRIEYKTLCPGDILGRAVRRVYHPPTGTHFALRTVNAEGRRPPLADLERLGPHPHLVTAYEVFLRSTRVCLLMELMDRGSLRDVLRATRLTEPEAVILAQHALRGLAALQGWGVLHRDLRPSRLLLNAAGTFKIASPGFGGFGTRLADGAPTYVAPERMVGEPYSFPADVWSLGLCLAQAVCGDDLRWRDTAAAADSQALATTPLFEQAGAVARRAFALVLHHLGAPFRELLDECLEPDWEQRPTADVLLWHRVFDPLRDGPPAVASTLVGRLAAPQQRC